MNENTLHKSYYIKTFKTPKLITNSNVLAQGAQTSTDVTITQYEVKHLIFNSICAFYNLDINIHTTFGQYCVNIQSDTSINTNLLQETWNKWHNTNNNLYLLFNVSLIWFPVVVETRNDFVHIN